MQSLIRNEWVKTKPFPHAWVAEEGDDLVAFISGHPRSPHPIVAQPPTAQIGDLYVCESHRRQGLATQLVDTFINHARAARFEQIEVGTLVQDVRAVNFWRAVGFRDLSLLLRLNQA